MTAAVQGGSMLYSLFSGLIAPRGDFQKFERTLFPYAKQKAAQSGFPVLILWFGDLLRVDPNGTFAIVLTKDQTSGLNALSPQILEFYEDFRTIESFWTIRETGNDNVNNPGGATYDFHELIPNVEPDLTPGDFDISDSNTAPVNKNQSPNPFADQGPQPQLPGISTAGFGFDNPWLLLAGGALLLYVMKNPITKGKRRR